MAEKDEEKDDILVVEETDSGEEVSGDLDSAKEEEKEKAQLKKPVKKRGNDQQKRMNELWLARKEAEEKANINAMAATTSNAKAAEYERITASALEENLNTKRELLTERLIRARETGDVKKDAEITAELSKIEAQSAQIERYKIENQVKPQKKEEQRHQQEQAPQTFDDLYEGQNKFGKEWLDRSRDWYDNSSENYDHDRVSDVTLYARSLEENFARNGTGFPPGSKGYFKQIDDYDKQNWGESVEEEQEEEKPAQKKSYAAPVGNRNAGSGNVPGRKEFKISQQEKDFALALNTKDAKGRPLSDDEKIKRFVMLREGTPSSGPISMSTIRKGN